MSGKQFCGSLALIAGAIVFSITLASASVSLPRHQQNSLQLRSSFHLNAKHPFQLPSCIPIPTQLPHWKGFFKDLNGKTACYTMVGTDPAKGAVITTIPTYIIPVRMVYGDPYHKVFDPLTHKVKGGDTVIQSVEASPVFDGSSDFTAGSVDLGPTQYGDAFQRGNFWSLVNGNGYHVMLGPPQILTEQTIYVDSSQGSVQQDINGVDFGTMKESAFDAAMTDALKTFPQVGSGALPIFITYNICLQNDNLTGCEAGYHSGMVAGLTLRTYAYASYADRLAVSWLDVGALSHEIGEWIDDPFGNNRVSCNNPLLDPPHTMEVGDPLEDNQNAFFAHGGFHLQSLAFLPYFGAPLKTSVNKWTSFRGPKDNLSVCGSSSFSVLYSFQGGSDGASPNSGVIMDGEGNLYGTTYYGGGASNDGTVFRVAPDGTETVLHSFMGTDGAHPNASVILDGQGNLYGTTVVGGKKGYGTVFKLALDGTETLLHSFTDRDGAAPQANVIMDGEGNLYGTAAYGSGGSRFGTVFKLAPDGTETVLYSFQGGSDGTQPFGSVTMDGAGKLYGTTLGGGLSSAGTVFRLAPDGTESVLYSFRGGNDGSAPNAGVIMDGAGNLYGTTTSGNGSPCNSYCGTVFRLTPAGTETVLHSFTGPDGALPFGGVIIDGQGNLYGTTFGGGASGDDGTVFRLAPDGTYTVLHSFTGSDGQGPDAGVIMDGEGNLYGTTAGGGCCGGTVFKLTP